MKQLLLIFFLLISIQNFSQELVYKSNGNIRNAENQRISSNEVRAILKNKPELLQEYNEGRSKKTVGNIMMVGGLGLITADLLQGLTADIQYPTALTYIGLASFVISIPVKIGFSKKIKHVVSDYNASSKVGNSDFEIKKATFITNKNGIGIKLAFN